MLIRIVIICLVFSIFASSFLKRTDKKRKTNRKTKIRSKIKAKTIVNKCDFQTLKSDDKAIITTKGFTSQFPEEFQTSNLAIEKAITQTKSARKLINSPGVEATDILKTMAKRLEPFITKFLNVHSSNNTLIKNVSNSDNTAESINRQNGIDGSWNKMSNAYNIHSLINRIIQKKPEPPITNLERLGLIGFIGDIAEKMSDFETTEKKGSPDSVEHKVYHLIRGSILKDKDDNTNKWILDEQHTNILKWKSKVIPADVKQAERGTCVVDAVNFKKLMNPRSGGVLNVGETQVGTGLTEFLNPTWPMQTVPEKRLNNCKDEPFAGHFSGSIVEILWLMDILTWETPHLQINVSDPQSYLYKDIDRNKQMLNSKNRKTKAALASAFLISTGMHSAVEVSVTVRQYLGEKKKKDDKMMIKENTMDSVCLNDQTKYISDLMDLRSS